jgi:hypothetical protein
MRRVSHQKQLQGTMSEEKETSLSLAISITVASFVVALVCILIKFGVNFSNFTKLFSHTGALGDFIAEALGASIVFPAVHVGIYSIFKSKRNKNTRRSIFIGWGLFLIVVSLLNLLFAAKVH